MNIVLNEFDLWEDYRTLGKTEIQQRKEYSEIGADSSRRLAPYKPLDFFLGHSIDGEVYGLCDLVEKFGYRIIMAKGGGYRLIDGDCSFKGGSFTSASEGFDMAIELQSSNSTGCCTRCTAVLEDEKYYCKKCLSEKSHEIGGIHMLHKTQRLYALELQNRS